MSIFNPTLVQSADLSANFRYFYCAVAPPGPMTPGQYRPHDLHCGTKDSSNGQVSNRGPRLTATEKKGPATCDLLSGIDYNRHTPTTTHRLEVDRAQPRTESTYPDEVSRGTIFMVARCSVDVRNFCRRARCTATLCLVP